MLGPALALAAALAALARKGSPPGPQATALRRGVIAAVVVGLTLLGAASFVQTRVWRNSESLFANGIIVNPRSWVAYGGMAAILESQASSFEPQEVKITQLNKAIELARRATELAPDLPDEFIVLGVAYTMLGQNSDAISSYSKAVQVDPEKAEALNRLGGALALNHQEDQAEPLLRKAIRIDPLLSEAHFNLGRLLAKRNGLGDEEAFRETQLSVRLDGSDPRARMDYAALLDARGAHAEALAQKQMAQQLDPSLR
jgi:tetratricopeptide (TPR) repeat protein